MFLRTFSPATIGSSTIKKLKSLIRKARDFEAACTGGLFLYSAHESCMFMWLLDKDQPPHGEESKIRGIWEPWKQMTQSQIEVNLTTCVLLIQLFQSASLCSAFSWGSLYSLLACCSKRSLWPCPASLCVSVSTRLSVSSLTSSLFLKNSLDSSSPAEHRSSLLFYISIQSFTPGFPLIILWISIPRPVFLRDSEHTFFFPNITEEFRDLFAFLCTDYKIFGWVPALKFPFLPHLGLTLFYLRLILNSRICLCVFLTSWPLFLWIHEAPCNSYCIFIFCIVEKLYIFWTHVFLELFPTTLRAILKVPHWPFCGDMGTFLIPGLALSLILMEALS